MEEAKYELKEDHIPLLRKARGPVFESAEELLKHADKPLIVVGDKSSYNILKAGGKPDLIIHDLKEKREEISQEVFDEIYGFVAPEMVVENPKGTISKKLWNIIKICLEQTPHRIRVIGEEDLAALAVCALAPQNSSIVYGFKNKLVLWPVTPEEKKFALRIIQE